MLAVVAILPIFVLIVLGYLLGWRQWLSAESAAGLANITFKLFMPTLLFAGIAKASLGDGLSPMLLLAYYLPVLLVFGLVNLFAHQQRGTATPLGLTAAFSNNVLVGIPLVTSLMGSEGLVGWRARAALPCALIVLGASLSRYRLRPSRTVLGLALAKLLLFPAMVWWLSGQLPGLSEAARSVLVLLAACPSGVNILAFAKTPEDTRNVSSAVFLSTVLAALTLPLWMLAVL